MVGALAAVLPHAMAPPVSSPSPFSSAWLPPSSVSHASFSAFPFSSPRSAVLALTGAQTLLAFLRHDMASTIYLPTACVQLASSAPSLSSASYLASDVIAGLAEAAVFYPHHWAMSSSSLSSPIDTKPVSATATAGAFTLLPVSLKTPLESFIALFLHSINARDRGDILIRVHWLHVAWLNARVTHPASTTQHASLSPPPPSSSSPQLSSASLSLSSHLRSHFDLFLRACDFSVSSPRALDAIARAALRSIHRHTVAPASPYHSSFGMPPTDDDGGRVSNIIDNGDDCAVALEPVECIAAASMVFLAHMLQSASGSEGAGSGSEVDENSGFSHVCDTDAVFDLVRLWQHSSSSPNSSVPNSPSDRERLELAMAAFFCLPPHALRPHCLWRLFAPLRKQAPSSVVDIRAPASHSAVPPTTLTRVPAPPPPPPVSTCIAASMGATASLPSIDDRISATGAALATGAAIATLQSPRHARVRSAARAVAAVVNPNVPLSQLPREESVIAPSITSDAGDSLPAGAGLLTHLLHHQHYRLHRCRISWSFCCHDTILTFLSLIHSQLCSHAQISCFVFSPSLCNVPQTPRPLPCEHTSARVACLL